MLCHGKLSSFCHIYSGDGFFSCMRCRTSIGGTMAATRCALLPVKVMSRRKQVFSIVVVHFEVWRFVSEKDQACVVFFFLCFSDRPCQRRACALCLPCISSGGRSFTFEGESVRSRGVGPVRFREQLLRLMQGRRFGFVPDCSVGPCWPGSLLLFLEPLLRFSSLCPGWLLASSQQSRRCGHISVSASWYV